MYHNIESQKDVDGDTVYDITVYRSDVITSHYRVKIEFYKKERVLGIFPHEKYYKTFKRSRVRESDISDTVESVKQVADEWYDKFEDHDGGLL